MRPDQALARVLSRSGVAFPRGVLGAESWALANALSGDGGDPAALAGAAAAEHWPHLRGAIQAAVVRAAQEADASDAEAYAIVGAWAADADPDNPLARALAARAALELGAARNRARGHLREMEDDLDPDPVRLAGRAAAVAGAISVELLDLDAEDFLPEITDYVAADRSEEGIDRLARTTGDLEIRRWARAALAELTDPKAPRACEVVLRVAHGEVPDDPAADLVWAPTILALAEEAIERALVEEAASGPPQAPRLPAGS